ncbi:hypothetical protein C8A05DRAFT_31563 [Staphylotrichum tortipilum]|uniref:Uncharacterized protein n=1 Tax=Staphylotrichum tortipilum TaxID=2831512 RepID=A0AAN6RV58_9PEZI|nr:hypothetical protein C8A05DRAFT_31563 [Staphylotrichum longicolle]
MPATTTDASAASPRRRRRIRAPSPESPIRTVGSASSLRHVSSWDRVARPATQPDPSDVSTSRSSKRRSKDQRQRKVLYLTDAEKLAWMDEFKDRRRRSKSPSPFPEFGPDEPTDGSGSAAVHTEDTPPPQTQSPKSTRLRKTRKGKGKEAAREATPEEAVPVPHRPTLDSDDDGPPPSAQPRGKSSRRDRDPGARGEAQIPRPQSSGLNGEHAAEPSVDLHEEARRDDINNGGDFRPADDMQVDSENAAERFTTTPRRPVVPTSLGGEDEPGAGSHVPSPASTPRPPRPGDGDEANTGHADDKATISHAAAPASTHAESAAQTPETRRRSKRKAKQPLSNLEEENTKAFVELPLNDDASLGRSGDAQLPAPVVTRPPARAPRAKRKKPDKRPDADADSNDEISTGKSQYRSGALSRAEQLQITNAVDQIRDAEGLSQEAINRVIHDNPRNSSQAIHRQLWAAIQDACPSRPRKKLMSWTRQRFHNFAGRGTWTPVQDDELADLIEKHGKKWSHIAGLINRYQKDVRDRWRNYLVCRHTVKTDAWSKDEEARFRELVESSINQIRLGSGGNTKKDPEALINWLQISEAMSQTRSRLQCMEKWKRMRAAEPLPDEVPTVLPQGNSRPLAKSRRDLRRLTAGGKYDLICAVRDSLVETDADINWTKIVDYTFAGRFERQALSVVWGRLRKAVPDWKQKTTRDCALHLCEMFEREGNFGSEDDLVNEPDAPGTKAKRMKTLNVSVAQTPGMGRKARSVSSSDMDDMDDIPATLPYQHRARRRH